MYANSFLLLNNNKSQIKSGFFGAASDVKSELMAEFSISSIVIVFEPSL
jgi:hypothetical protein